MVATAMWKETWIHVRQKSEDHKSEIERVRLEAEVDTAKLQGRLEQSEALATKLERQLAEARAACQELDQGSRLVSVEGQVQQAGLKKARLQAWRVAAGKLDRFVRRSEGEVLGLVVQRWFHEEGVLAKRYQRMQKEWRKEQGKSPQKQPIAATSMPKS